MRIEMHTHRRNENAQTMVEFALVFPMVLMIVYGLIEIGRMLFIYSSLTSSAREGARYGAAAGDVGGLLPHYADCNGIKQASMRSGAFAGVQEVDIDIEYDHGPNAGFPQAPNCPPFDNNGMDIINMQGCCNDRIVVTVTVFYEPIINFLGFNGFQMESQNARTIISSVSIIGTPPPPWPTDNP